MQHDVRKQFHLTNQHGIQVWYLDTVDQQANVLSGAVSYWDLHFHREGGPAFIDADGYQSWFLNNERHRIDGPACIWPDGDCSWWVDGVELSKKEFHIVQSLQQTK